MASASKVAYEIGSVLETISTENTVLLESEIRSHWHFSYMPTLIYTTVFLLFSEQNASDIFLQTYFRWRCMQLGTWLYLETRSDISFVSCNDMFIDSCFRLDKMHDTNIVFIDCILGALRYALFTIFVIFTMFCANYRT